MEKSWKLSSQRGREHQVTSYQLTFPLLFRLPARPATYAITLYNFWHIPWVRFGMLPDFCFSFAALLFVALEIFDLWRVSQARVYAQKVFRVKRNGKEPE